MNPNQRKTNLKKNPPEEKTVEPEAKEKSSRPDPKRRYRPRRSVRRKGDQNHGATDIPAAPLGTALEDNWDISHFEVPPAEGKSRFHDFNLPVPLMHAICDLGFQYCTPIQAEILPGSLAGRDATGRAQTGTGKTAVFLITVITRMLLNPDPEKRAPGIPRILILSPTRELALQISAEARDLSKYCDMKIISVFGGMDYEKQRKQLHAGPVDIIVATPGRLLDFQGRREVNLKKIEVLIIDEADRMLDMGFIPDVRKIINSTPAKTKRQTLLFSATLTGEVARYASQWTHNSVTVEIEPEQVAVDTVDQIVYNVTTAEKFALLYNIIDRQNLDRVLVFCNRRDEVRRLAEKLTRYGINCSELSGEVSQKNRIQRLDEFKTGKIRVLVATDVAGRGLHIEGMDHVINYTLPRDAEDYVHRIGRTGRAGAAGTSVSFADEQDGFYLPAIEAFIGRGLSCIEPMEDWLSLPESVLAKERARPRRKRSDAPAAQGRAQTRSRSQRRPPRRR